MEKPEPSYTAGGNGKCGTTALRNSPEVSHKVIHRPTYDPTAVLSDIYLKERKAPMHTKICI